MLLVSKAWNRAVKNLPFVQELKEQKEAYIAYTIVYTEKYILEVFQNAAKENLTSLFKFLLKNQIVDYDVCINMAASRACMNGYRDCKNLASPQKI